MRFGAIDVPMEDSLSITPKAETNASSSTVAGHLNHHFDRRARVAQPTTRTDQFRLFEAIGGKNGNLPSVQYVHRPLGSAKGPYLQITLATVTAQRALTRDDCMAVRISENPALPRAIPEGNSVSPLPLARTLLSRLVDEPTFEFDHELCRRQAQMRGDQAGVDHDLRPLRRRFGRPFSGTSPVHARALLAGN